MCCRGQDERTIPGVDVIKLGLILVDNVFFNNTPYRCVVMIDRF